MSFKTQYLNDISLLTNPYININTAINRLSKIYGTSRKGNISLSRSTFLWNNYFHPIYFNLNNIPTNQRQFDTYIINQIINIEQFLISQNIGAFGVAQKLLNLFFKDLWALNIISKCIDSNLHAPLDRLILNKIKNKPNTWSAWTKANSNNTSTVQDYQLIQDLLRAYLINPAPGTSQLFKSLIEMEQFIWHSI